MPPPIIPRLCLLIPLLFLLPILIPLAVDSSTRRFPSQSIPQSSARRFPSQSIPRSFDFPGRRFPNPSILPPTSRRHLPAYLFAHRFVI